MRIFHKFILICLSSALFPLFAISLIWINFQNLYLSNKLDQLISKKSPIIQPKNITFNFNSGDVIKTDFENILNVYNTWIVRNKNNLIKNQILTVVKVKVKYVGKCLKNERHLSEWTCKFFKEKDLEDFTSNFFNFLIIITVFFSLIIVFPIYLIVKKLVSPLEKISNSLINNQIEELKEFENNTAIEIRTVIVSLKEYVEKRKEYQRVIDKEIKEESEFRIASQVAHDIRSPLAALEMISAGISSLSNTESEILFGSIERIRSIANNLLNKNPLNEKDTHFLVSDILNEIVSEKRAEYRYKQNLKIYYEPSLSNYGIFITCNEIKFKTVLSNLINNSIEAFDDDDGGEIQIQVKVINNEYTISIVDNGKGIPERYLKDIFKRGVSIGKENISGAGTGLGLFQVKEYIESISGKIIIKSNLKYGTRIELTFAMPPKPDWFAREITLKNFNRFFIADSNDINHKILKNKLKDNFNGEIISTIYLPTISQNNSLANNIFYLIDLEFDQSDINGIDFIVSNKIENRSILLTSKHKDIEIQKLCEYHKIKILPKYLIQFIPIVI